MTMSATRHPHPPKALFQAAKTHPHSRRLGAGSSFLCLPDGWRLELCVPSPSAETLRQFCEGEVRVALVQRGAAAVLLHRFGSLPWRAAVCDGEALGKEKRRVFQALARERRLPFHFSAGLIDRDGKALLAVRPAMLSPTFASCIGKAMRAGEARADGPAAQAADLDWLMTQSPADLLGLAGVYERALSEPVPADGPPADFF
jgi:hypothetical protein